MHYATLGNHRNKNLEADAQNPNLYSSLENLETLKDNRKIEENIYDEIRLRRRTLLRQDEAARSSGRSSTGIVEDVNRCLMLVQPPSSV